MKKPVVYYGDVSPVDLGGGVSRKVLAHDDQMMIVEVRFEKGGIGAPHTHPHLQLTYVLDGRFRFTVDGIDYEVTKGDTLRFPPDAVHGTVCLEAGLLLDIFNPARQDFL